MVEIFLPPIHPHVAEPQEDGGWQIFHIGGRGVSDPRNFLHVVYGQPLKNQNYLIINPIFRDRGASIYYVILFRGGGGGPR